MSAEMNPPDAPHGGPPSTPHSGTPSTPHGGTPSTPPGGVPTTPPGEAPPGGGEAPQALRGPAAARPARPVLASDAERDQVATILGGQYAEGRLTLDEYQERTAAVYAARTWDDLAYQVRDLPVPLPFLAPRPPPTSGPPAYPGPVTFPGPAAPLAAAGTGRWNGDDTLIVILLCLVFPPAAIAYALLRHRRPR